MRYAIYFALDADAQLMRLGNHWLGRDPYAGQSLVQPDVPGMTAERFHQLTVSPRRYGFHGTLKAPFALKDGETEAALIEACADFAAAVSPFDLVGLDVHRLGSFLALTPTAQDNTLNAFAALCVRHFERFRAPLSAEDLERRRQAKLTAKQDGYVANWGYPYIFDEFRFHMTLSEKLDEDQDAHVLADSAKDHFSPVANKPIACRQFGLYAEPQRGKPFVVQQIFDLTGCAAAEQLLAEAEQTTPEETA